ncbi:hypothetical protein GUJ93_ZPchr0004g39834 [Zizania palustris]|uniref:Uncharacterized protein n=1 Tax=Zizania palustris TaxID=103762 RepID=A0A8J5VFP7_ZIZPA|nr:hypothetical protein GUJ93_ZPchr0004g39834 [Zizania palustris]
MIFPQNHVCSIFPLPSPPRFSRSPLSPSARLPFAASPPPGGRLCALRPPPHLPVAASASSARLPVDASMPPGGSLPASPLPAIGVSFDISDSKGSVIQSTVWSED